MCTPTETLSLVLFLAFAGVTLRAGLLQQRFARALRSAAPAVWANISTWHRWNENSDLHESAVASYILQGSFSSLPQPALVQQGAICRRWHFASFTALLVFGVYSSITQVFIPIACLWGGARP
jgi:hypothetical protein